MGQIIKVSLDLVKPTQKSLRLSSIPKILNDLENRLLIPLPVRRNNNNYLAIDGHNRLAVAKYLNYSTMQLYITENYQDLMNKDLFSQEFQEAIKNSNEMIIRRFENLLKDRSIVASRNIINIGDMYGYKNLPEIINI